MPKAFKISFLRIIFKLYLSWCCYNKDTINWVAHKQQKFISHSSDTCEVQDHGTSRFDFRWELTSWFIPTPSHYNLTQWKGQTVLLPEVSFIKAKYLLNTPHPNALITSWGLDFIIWIGGGGRTQIFNHSRLKSENYPPTVGSTREIRIGELPRFCSSWDKMDILIDFQHLMKRMHIISLP